MDDGGVTFIVHPDSPTRSTPSPLSAAIEERSITFGKASIWASSLNLINNVIGAGLFSMPWAMKRASIGGGLLLLGLICLLNTTCYIILAQCCDLSGSFTYLGIGRKSFGDSFGKFAQFCVLFYSFGSMLSFVVLTGDFLGGETGYLQYPREVVIVVVAVCVFTPLSLLRNTEPLKWTSLVSFVACFGAAGLIVMAAMWKPPEAFPASDPVDREREVSMMSLTNNAWAAVPVMSVAFTAHYNGPRFYQELSDRSLYRYGHVIAFGMAFSFASYLAVGVCGYLTFGEATLGSILMNYSPTWRVAKFARLFLSMVVSFTFPLANHAARESILSLISGGEVTTNNSPPEVFLPLTLLLVFITTLLGIYFTEIEKVLAFKGALFGTCIVYIFPPIMYVRLRELNREAKRHGDESEADLKLDFEGIVKFVKLMGPMLLIPLWGVSTAILSIHSVVSR
eukprot:TRINITY_DN28027_c0_g1_i1.p1 TRINITY_DN28027_c0_g1~~TRINITY_DN28027_c0_g1_i1.p1  ORF type:complete len:452 (+),score=41.52 TRINITY_DN28027_c0_g1_i1:96-1451(+)